MVGINSIITQWNQFYHTIYVHGMTGSNMSTDCNAGVPWIAMVDIGWPMGWPNGQIRFIWHILLANTSELCVCDVLIMFKDLLWVPRGQLGKKII